MSLAPVVEEAIAAAGLDSATIERLARAALEEDLAGGVDVTTLSTVPEGHRSTADFVVKESGVIAGLPAAMAVLDIQVGETLTARTTDGNTVQAGDIVLSVSGPTREILTAERTALNILCHLSGVASTTAAWVKAVEGTGTVVRDTRKTTPGLRSLEKYAVRAGGGKNHRMGLNDQALIKDNHLVVAGGVGKALDAVRNAYPGLIYEVECDTVAQVEEAIEAGAALILLDNMSLADTRKCVELAAGRSQTEASGGLTLGRAREVAETGVDFLAVGALTHSAAALDISLEVRAA
ncbi:MAG TPA: carboxylating nicotinate-nucleotide diphosphorylase [Mycobacteriales bacterium]|nr:carboxylating nicotinate-nucleotide diphosphorylase [Mycobacteriales bacterium]